MEVAGNTDRHDVDHRTADDLIHLVANREHAKEHRHEQTDEDTSGDAQEQVLCVKGNHETEERRGQHHAFNADVDDAAALAKDTAQSAQGQGGSQA